MHTDVNVLNEKQMSCNFTFLNEVFLQHFCPLPVKTESQHSRGLHNCSILEQKLVDFVYTIFCPHCMPSVLLLDESYVMLTPHQLLNRLGASWCNFNL